MAKNKKNVNLKSLNISYKDNEFTYKLVLLKASNMTVDLRCYEDDKYIKDKTIPFAHLPKAIKILVKPT